jgi:hypothetical protein
MRHTLLALLLAATFGQASAACPVTELKAAAGADWKVADDGVRQALAVASLDCLADPDPLLRDTLAFSALQAWMRGGQLQMATVQTVRLTLLPRLTAPDGAGFGRPFAALVLAEVARIDRLQPYLTPAQRAELVEAAANYLAGVRDYRGFDAREGWRHGVAHGADLMLQLSLNAALQPAALQRLLGAIGQQVAPAGEHFYHYGEGERLMAPVYYLARRADIGCGEWERWLAAVSAGDSSSQSQATLARRHNLKGFLQPLALQLEQGQDPNARACLLPLVRRTLLQLSQ